MPAPHFQKILGRGSAFIKPFGQPERDNFVIKAMDDQFRDNDSFNPAFRIPAAGKYPIGDKGIDDLDHILSAGKRAFHNQACQLLP